MYNLFVEIGEVVHWILSEKRLDQSVKLLQSHTKNTVRSVFEQEEVECAKFTGWLLGNFEHPTESQVVTGLEIQLDGIDQQKGLLVFLPTGYFLLTRSASFGMMVDFLGFISITRPYDWQKFRFDSNVHPTLRLWYHVDHSNPNAHSLRKYNSTQTMPKTTSFLVPEKGIHTIPIKDEFGIVGMIEYEMDGVGEGDDGIHPDQLGGNLLQFLQKEETKACVQVLRVLIHPQTLLSSIA